MKKLFQAIRKQDLETVRQLLTKHPELISCTAKQPPKKDDGQSPLQVALKTGAFPIAELLLDLGADVNFIEAEDCRSGWRAPAVHDAINAAVMTSRWNLVRPEGLEVFHTEEEANRAFRLLERMTALGADVNAADSYGNTGLWRLCLQARQILPSYNRREGCLSGDRVLTPELEADLSQVFRLLKASGMEINARGSSGLTVWEQFRGEPVLAFLEGAV